MTKKQYLKLNKILKKVIDKAESQALDEGVDITSADFLSILEEIKENFIEAQGFTISEYQEFKKEIKKVEIQESRGERGEKGEAGEKGIGEIGEKGKKGETGEIGQKGSEGIKGKKGEIGLQGEKGEKGDKGDKGETGKVPEEKLTELQKELQKDLEKYVNKTILTPRERVSDIGGRFANKFFNWGMPDAGSYGTAIADSRYYKKTEVDNSIDSLEDTYVPRTEWLQNGFPNITDSAISFSDGNRRFTINPSNGSFDYFIAGVKYTVSSSDVVNVNYVDLTDTEGDWWIYYDGSTLTATRAPNHAAVRDIYENKAAIAIVFWDADNSKGQFVEDRHGISMSPITHILIHETVGVRFDNGLALNTIDADQDGSADSHAQFGVDAGQIYDEDLEHSLNAIGSTTGLQIWYRDTSGWTFTTNAGFSVVKTGAGGEDRLAYDNNGTLTEVGDNDFVLVHIFAAGFSHNNPVVAIGQAQYSTKKAAQQGALTEITNILSIANISPELKPIASVIFQTKDTYSNTMKAKIVSTDEGDDYVDFRTDVLSPAFSSAQEHGNLAGLGDDDHTQYLLVNGTRNSIGIQIFEEGIITPVDKSILFGSVAGGGTIGLLSTDAFFIENGIEDGDLVFRINDGGVAKTITWDADVDKLKHSHGTFNFDDDNLLTTGTIGGGAITGTSFIIGGNTLTTTEWAYLDGQDQALKTTDDPIFDDITVDKATFNETASFDAEFDNGNSGAADTIDWRVGNCQKSTLTGDVTYTFTDPAGACRLSFRTIQDGTGGRSITHDGDVQFASGIPPAVSSGAGAVDVYHIYFDGAKYHLLLAIRNSS